MIKQSFTGSTVCLLAWFFYWKCQTACVVRCSAGRWWRKYGSRSTVRSVCGFRYGRPWHTAATSEVITWFWGPCTSNVSIVLNWSHTGCTWRICSWTNHVHIYTSDLVHIIHGLCLNLFAIDTQVYGRCWHSEMGDLAARVLACTDDILNWMQSNRLQLNADKTKLIQYSTSRWLQQLHTTSIRVGYKIISPSSSVRDLSIYIDADLFMWTQMQLTVAGYFAALHQICSVCRSLPFDALQTLLVLLVVTQLAYGNAMLTGNPAYLLCCLQCVMISVAMFVTLGTSLCWFTLASGCCVNSVQIGDTDIPLPSRLSSQLSFCFYSSCWWRSFPSMPMFYLHRSSDRLFDRHI